MTVIVYYHIRNAIKAARLDAESCRMSASTARKSGGQIVGGGRKVYSEQEIWDLIEERNKECEEKASREA